jgi:arylsulfatase A-like enzyme
MKILVVNFRGAEPQILFGDERLENLRRLMDMGCFGELKGEACDWNVLARQENHTLTLLEFLGQAGKHCAGFDDFAALRNKLEAQDWDYCLFTDARLGNASDSAGTRSADEYFRLDRELGEVLQHLSDDTVIAVVGDGCFILVSANNPIIGLYSDGSSSDISPTVLELAGYPLPSETEGESWVAGMELKTTSGLTTEEEAMLRERLSGLGYI